MGFFASLPAGGTGTASRSSRRVYRRGVSGLACRRGSLPVFIPLAAVLLAAGAATLWLQYSASGQIKVLASSMLTVQQELGAAHEA